MTCQMYTRNTYNKTDVHFERNYKVYQVNTQKAWIHRKTLIITFGIDIEKSLPPPPQKKCIYKIMILCFIYSFESNFFHWNYEDFI